MGISTEHAINDIIIPSIGDTFIMLGLGFLFAAIIGFAVALVLITVSPMGLRPNVFLYRILDFVVNVLRSTPFIILMITLMPLCRLLFGTVIGLPSAIFSLTISCSALIARLLEGAFREVDPCLIEAARSFGASDLSITSTVIVGETVPAMVSNLTLASISALSGTAMAGVVGAGGLGAVALTYGYQNFNDFIMYSTVIILIVITQIIQLIGNGIYRAVK